MYQVEKFK